MAGGQSDYRDPYPFAALAGDLCRGGSSGGLHPADVAYRLVRLSVRAAAHCMHGQRRQTWRNSGQGTYGENGPGQPAQHELVNPSGGKPVMGRHAEGFPG